MGGASYVGKEAEGGRGCEGIDTRVDRKGS